MAANADQSVQTRGVEHEIATGRGLRQLLEWGADFARAEQARGRRVIWAPCHALGACVSLRSWLLDQATRMFGDGAPPDAATLLAAAADSLIIADPGSADPQSLDWLTEMLACAEEARGLTATPPLPKLVVLALTGADHGEIAGFLARMKEIGANFTRVPGRGPEPSARAISSAVDRHLLRNEAALAALALLPIPVDLADFSSVATAAGASTQFAGNLLDGPLFARFGEMAVATRSDARRLVLERLAPSALRSAARLVLRSLERRLVGFPDARLELLMRAGETRKATSLARRRFDEHFAAGRFAEALRTIRCAHDLGLALDRGPCADEIRRAKTAALLAKCGDSQLAIQTLSALTGKRKLRGVQEVAEWLAVAAQTLAVRRQYDARAADSLMRRAIRLARDSTDRKLRLILTRVSLLRSEALNLQDRADWLLSHIHRAMLAKVSKATRAAYYEEIATRLAARGDFKGAFKRLRQITEIAATDRQSSRVLLLMARCRAQVGDREAADRYASSALQYGLRATSLSLVKEAAAFLKLAEKQKPRAAPQIVPASRRRRGRAKTLAPAEIRIPNLPDPLRIFEVMETRFGLRRWVRRRAGKATVFGRQVDERLHAMSVYEESGRGGVLRTAQAIGIEPELRGLVLLRQDGDDLVYYVPPTGAEPSEHSIVRFLLSDRQPAEMAEIRDAPPRRKTVLNEYLSRALAHGVDRGLHATMEMLFNKDLLIYLEERGLSKDEMALRLNVSRATIYRMYRRTGLG